MFTEIKDGKRIVIKKITIEKDIDAVLKEFNFEKVDDYEWDLSDFTIMLYFFGDDNIPHISLYYKEEPIAHYQTYSHRMWWHGKYPSGDMIELSQEESVMNDLMNKLRTKWDAVKNAH